MQSIELQLLDFYTLGDVDDFFGPNDGPFYCDLFDRPFPL